MVCNIMKVPVFLEQKSIPAVNTPKDLPTLPIGLQRFQKIGSRCVGMAANMIGVPKRIIAFQNGNDYMLMFNPVIVKSSDGYEAEEGCLSLSGVRKTTRYQTIEVNYLDQSFKPRKQLYTGWIAQVIQHEIDHCNGILI